MKRYTCKAEIRKEEDCLWLHLHKSKHSWAIKDDEVADIRDACNNWLVKAVDNE